MIGLIGGTSSARPDGEWLPLGGARTPYGPASGPILSARDWPGLLCLDRHGGDDGRLLPHEVNYRANLWLLRERGAERVLAAYAVGGIAAELPVGALVLPHQLIDYTWGRAHTFAGVESAAHVDFAEPFDAGLRQTLRHAAAAAGVDVHDGGVYGCTQGPRLETAAEVDRMANDGCTLVGMTAMPEAALARELALPFAAVCLVVNPSAGRGPPGTPTAANVHQVVAAARRPLIGLLTAAIPLLRGEGVAGKGMRGRGVA